MLTVYVGQVRGRRAELIRCRIYVDNMTGENCRPVRLLFLVSFIGQSVHPVEEEGMV